jgi:glycogen debranching enzyme
MNSDEIKQRLLKDIEKLRSKEGYLNAGWPRYNTLFGRDSLISAWQTLQIAPSVARDTLETLAKYQGRDLDSRAEEEPGKILHEYRFDPEKQAELPRWSFPYYGSVDSTPLFVIVADKYLQQTNDIAFVSKIWNNITAAFNWMLRFGDMDADGYVEYRRRNPAGLFHQGWKDGIRDHLRIKPPVALVEVQGYVYAACISLVSMARKLGRNDIVKQASTRSKVLKKRFNTDFWMQEKNYFALALDGEKRQRKAVTSNPGHLLFTGLVSSSKIRLLISRLFKPDLWTHYGIRTHSAEETDFDPYSYQLGSVWPHDNWIIYTGLRQLGFNREASRIKKALLDAYGELGKIPELYAVVDGRIADLSKSEVSEASANPLQAWASAGLLEMIWND